MIQSECKITLPERKMKFERTRKFLNKAIEKARNAGMRVSRSPFARAALLTGALLSGCGQVSEERVIHDIYTGDRIPSAEIDDSIDAVCTSKKSAILKVMRVFPSDESTGDFFFLGADKEEEQYFFFEPFVQTPLPFHVAIKNDAPFEIEGTGTLTITEIGETPYEVRIHFVSPNGEEFDFETDFLGLWNDPNKTIVKMEDGSFAIMDGLDSVLEQEFEHADIIFVYSVGETAWGFHVDNTTYGIEDGVLCNDGKRDGCMLFNVPAEVDGLAVLLPSVVIESDAEGKCGEIFFSQEVLFDGLQDNDRDIGAELCE
jgi:hypothetical protein